MPCLTTLAHSCSAVVLPIWTMSSPKEVQKQSHSCSCQGCKATNHTETLLSLAKHWNSPEPSGTFRKLPPEPTQHTPELSGTFRNPPEPSGTCLRKLHQHTPELSQTWLRSLHQHTPELSGTFRNPPEPSGTCLRNPHTPEPSGTFRNLPPEPTTPAHTGNLHQHTPELSGTFRNSPEPSGTFLRNLLLKPTPAYTGAYLGWRPH